jgi:hypothetical protein
LLFLLSSVPISTDGCSELHRKADRPGVVFDWSVLPSIYNRFLW